MKSKRRIGLLCLVALLAACAAPLPPPVTAPPPPPVAPLKETTPSLPKPQPPPPPPPPPQPKPQPLPQPQPPSREAPKEDEELFIRGLRQLSDLESEDNPGMARQTLATLLAEHPQSKWREAARTTLRLLDELDNYRRRFLLAQDQSVKLSAEKNNSAKEIERLKKELRLLNEKYQTDLTASQQEKEQLKKDLQLLKNLEIQREKREKMLR